MSVTPSQTVGPYFQIGLIHERWTRLAAGPGERICIEGAVHDAEGVPVTDAMLEIWQPERAAFGRVATDPVTGRFLIECIRPAVTPEGAPHLCVGVFARGLLKRLYTRIYLDADPANATDPILALVPAERRPTLIAAPTGPGRYRLDIRLSGPGETVFFEC